MAAGGEENALGLLEADGAHSLVLMGVLGFRLLLLDLLQDAIVRCLTVEETRLHGALVITVRSGRSADEGGIDVVHVNNLGSLLTKFSQLLLHVEYRIAGISKFLAVLLPVLAVLLP